MFIKTNNKIVPIDRGYEQIATFANKQTTIEEIIKNVHYSQDLIWILVKYGMQRGTPIDESTKLMEFIRNEFRHYLELIFVDEQVYFEIV